MQNSKTIFHQIVAKLVAVEDLEEKQSIAFMVMEDVFAVNRTDIISGKFVDVDSTRNERIESIISRLNNQEPIQYILEYAYFFGRKFHVTPDVLIPRPETEELVQQVIDIVKNQNSLKILDIGTGSGCIPVTLALETAHHISALDVSPGALNIARQNAQQHGAKVAFSEFDILSTNQLPEQYDLMISNPPYIADAEKIEMQDHVLKYEPHLALFVPNDDPLMFYRAIANRCKKSLLDNGMVIVEINQRFGNEVAKLFADFELRDVIVIRDMFGKSRFVKARK